MKIVSWQSVLTDHQSHTLRALQEEAKESVLIISGVKELKQRQAQGWTGPGLSGLHVQYLSSTGWLREGLTVLRENDNAIHLFNGLWADYRFFFLLLEAQRRGIRTGLVTEPYAEIATGYLQEESRLIGRIKSILRPFLYGFAGLLVAKRLCSVFAISGKAMHQFARIGVRKECLFPFGYFVPALEITPPESVRFDQELRLVFVGSLIQRKGIQVLIDALKICNHNGIKMSLSVYGHGDASGLAGEKGVSYKGVIPFGDAQRVIADYDLLVLPSLHDGWGVVVNEALLQGVPALVSDQVGAKSLVEKSGAGMVVWAGDVERLVKCLEDISRNPERLLEWKDAAVAFRKQLVPELAARYMYECVQHAVLQDGVRPDNPWYIYDISNA